MKIRRQRDDFVVDEMSDFRIGKGPFAVYTLEKSGIGTAEAVAQVVRHWEISRNTISFGGRKDRHAVTRQTVTVRGGPPQDLECEQFSLLYRGQSHREFTANDIRGNRFEIQVRSLESSRAEKMAQWATSSSLRFPNYFDQQRFGSVGVSGDFTARPWCLGKYEEALFLALAEDNAHDSPAEREQRSILRSHWNDWSTCKKMLDPSNRRSVVTYLVDHPTGFKKAVALISRDMRSLYVAAFQSRLWNEVASRWINKTFGEEQTLKIDCLEIGEITFPMLPMAAFPDTEFEIPLPSGRSTSWPADVKPLLEEVCATFGLSIHQLRFSHPRDVFFSRKSRPVMICPQNVETRLGSDDLAASPLSKLYLKFELGPGQYATMLLRYLELITSQ